MILSKVYLDIVSKTEIVQSGMYLVKKNGNTSHVECLILPTKHMPMCVYTQLYHRHLLIKLKLSLLGSIYIDPFFKPITFSSEFDVGICLIF